MNALNRSDVLRPESMAERDFLELADTFEYADRHRALINELSPLIRWAIVDMGNDYMRGDRYTSLKKLFKNTVAYVAAGKIRHNEQGFLVQGSTGDHQVIVDDLGIMSCDCDLFNGRGKFAGHADNECSHIQSSTLLTLAETHNETLDSSSPGDA
jgi:hypothetical protein